MKIRIDVTKRTAIAHIRDYCECVGSGCEECPSEIYCKSLHDRGIKRFEELEDYQIQAIINRIDGVERMKEKGC